MGTKNFNGISGEVGALDGLPFRFVVLQDMVVAKGQGSEVGGANDAGTAKAQSMAYKTLGSDGKSYYDVHSMVVVGDDAYTTLSYGWNNVMAEHIKPTRVLGAEGSGVDAYKTQGAIVTEWSYGFLCYRPERLRELVFVCRKDGKID
jgi:N4-gp56 family major capsid protein